MNKKCTSSLCITLFFITLPFSSYAMDTPSTLDPSFGNGTPKPGLVLTNLGGTFDIALALIRQPDGKLVVAGSTDAGSTADFVLIRYNSDGSLDTTFNGTGIAITDFYSGFDVAYALILQPDGKLVAAGETTSIAGNTSFALARYLPNGSLDPTFGFNGKVFTSIGTSDTAYALILQPDGKLVAAGRTDNNFALVRYNPGGNLDATFNGTGIVITDFDTGFDTASALILQPDGKLVAAGQAVVNGTTNFALARYLPNGILDPDFGTGGKVVTDFAGGADEAHTLILQPDGKLVAAGQALVDSTTNFALARYLANGMLDQAFGVNGKVTTDFSSGIDITRALILQPDGKLVAAGQAVVDGTINFALARYLPNGTLDVTFNPNGSLPGTVTTNFALNKDNIAYALILQPSGTKLKLVAAGEAVISESTSDVGLAQYFAINDVSPIASAVIAKYCF